MFDYKLTKQTSFNDACLAFSLAHKGDLVKIAESVGMNPQMLRNKLNPEQPHQVTCSDIIKLTYATKDPSLLDGVLEQLNCQPSVPMTDIGDNNVQGYLLGATAEVGKLANHVVNGGHINSIRSAEIKQSVNNAIRCLALVGVTISARFHSNPALVSAIDTVVGFGQSMV